MFIMFKMHMFSLEEEQNLEQIKEFEKTKATNGKMMTKHYWIDIYYGWSRLLTQGQLTDPSLNSLFIKTITICETNDNEANDHKSQ